MTKYNRKQATSGLLKSEERAEGGDTLSRRKKDRSRECIYRKRIKSRLHDKSGGGSYFRFDKGLLPVLMILPRLPRWGMSH